ncbi:uncharacterized protein LOC129910376 [Episyrphus balteatus]|uniref:uncharacterized protein LOC129910376 n=1 Tax=Episyrphus balteatus TaxID=286459 RepID=UPI002486B62F|nr:uncharacterized protein LOC129910376 [Episyrphus balteatus]
MFRLVFLVCIAALAAAKPHAEPAEFTVYSSRVPGDQLIFESSHGRQNVNFFGKATFEIDYPQNGSRSPYIITHIEVLALRETTGLMQTDLYGGIGTDFMRLKLIANSVLDGSYKVTVYGKKK